jgi:hypothetical protein
MASAGNGGDLSAPGRRLSRALSRANAAGRGGRRRAAGPATARPVVTRRHAAPGTAPCGKPRGGPSSVPGIVSPSEITVKGAPAARRLLRNRRPLSSDLARQVLGTYRKDGADRVRSYFCL